MIGILKKIISSKNDRIVGHYRREAQKIEALEEKYKKLSDSELKAAFFELKIKVRNAAGMDKSQEQKLEEKEQLNEEESQILEGNFTKKQEIELAETQNEEARQKAQKALKEVLADVFAIVREASVRTLGMRHFAVQLIGGMVLNDGKIAEMKTGEGKTLVASLPVCLNAILGQVHVVTVNDYLAARDAETLRPLYEFLGFSVSAIISSDYENREKCYSCDIVYGTNSEFGFDYLRDNMKYDYSQKFQKTHFYAIVDEVDSILIDEARTPLIISGPANKTLDNYTKANEVALKLEEGKHYSVDEKMRTILLSEEGINAAEELFGIDNLYNIENAILAHHLDQALKANKLFHKDKEYVLRDGEVIIVDEFTGRLSEGRRFSEGLHQALEAKEGVTIKEESQTLADTTYQNYFRLYAKLAGMTGTAQTEAAEFIQIYNLDVISIPTNIPVLRKDLNDLIYKTEAEKFKALGAKIQELHEKGQPILVGTASIEKSEKIHELLAQMRIPHCVLNAKQHAKEAEIIKDAGLKGAVTIATNMAGRGVDIKITDEVRALGGLYILGTERHESRRIDNQLRGRSGRQGDPGTSQFYLSLEDPLLRIFGSDKIKTIMDKLGLDEGEHIESKLVTRSVENAQKKVESMHFEARKHLLEYDDVANEQRKAIYHLRDSLLNPKTDISERIEQSRAQSVQILLQKAEIFTAEDDLAKLCAITLDDFGVAINPDNLAAVFEAENTIEPYLNNTLKEAYESKFGEFGELREKIEKLVYLQSLDHLWREHLYVMDTMKTGIGLRSYNQKDPLVEYKKESYNLFLELASNIKYSSYKMLHRLQFAASGAQSELEAAQTSMKNKAPTINGKREPTIVGSRPSRNSPCPCGSGKKYKDCHGKSGPKRGLAAN